MCGTVEFDTALIIIEPCLIIPPLLVLLTDHVAGRVVQEQQWRVGAVGQLDELRGLLRLLAEQHARGDWPGCRSDSRTACAQPVTSDEPYSGLNSSNSEPSTMRAMTSRGSNGIRRSAGTMPSSSSASNSGSASRAGRRALLAPVQPRDDAPADADRVELVDRRSSPAKTRSAGVHFGAAQRLVVGFLAGGHLHQRRPGQEHLRAFLDHHHVSRTCRGCRRRRRWSCRTPARWSGCPPPTAGSGPGTSGRPG